jgi:predicted phage terminase large subunit-like protein
MSALVEKGVELYRKHQPTIFCVEANQFQELLCDEFERQFANHPALSGTPPTEGNKSNIVASALALDPSKGKDSSRGDYSAFVFVALSEDGTFYVDAHLERLPTSALVAKGVELYRKYQPNIFCVEANQFQELLCDEFERQLVRVYPLENKLNKTIRIRRLEPYLSSRRLRFCASSPSCRLLVEQLRSFPVGSHDDGPDALEMALRMVEFCHG